MNQIPESAVDTSSPAVEEIQRALTDIQNLLSRQRKQEQRSPAPAGSSGEGAEVLAELRSLISGMSPALIARILEMLPQDESLAVWEIAGPEKGDEVLEELSETVRESFVTPPTMVRLPIQLNAFELKNGRLHQITVGSRTDLASAQPVWVDLVAPTQMERDWVEEIFGLKLPDIQDLTDLEESARFYIEDNGEVHLHSDFLLDKADESRNVPVAFILHNNVLFSVRNEELPVFRLQRMRARIQPGYVTDGKDLLLDLYAADVEYSADALEYIYADLERIGKKVLSPHVTDEEAASILSDIAGEEDLNGRIRRNVMDTRRAISLLIRSRILSPDQQEDARQILRDIESLDGHTAYIFGKINFFMDATVGFININQNKIVKIFSVAAVALLPPTLIASVYGMNFKFLPELDWTYGYPFALGLMVVSVALPFWFFRRKGWLR